jgi:hypothetical protein
MALYYDLPVFKDVYDLTLRLFELTQQFSREYKFTLGQDMKRDCLMLVRSIYRANKCKEREAYLEQFLLWTPILLNLRQSAKSADKNPWTIRGQSADSFNVLAPAAEANT